MTYAHIRHVGKELPVPTLLQQPHCQFVLHIVIAEIDLRRSNGISRCRVHICHLTCKVFDICTVLVRLIHLIDVQRWCCIDTRHFEAQSVQLLIVHLDHLDVVDDDILIHIIRKALPYFCLHPFNEFILAKTPANRWGTTEDLEGPAIFLASDASNFVNGHILYVDGGILAYIGKQP